MTVPSQWDFTAPFEGVVPHLYLDTAGLVTAGVGFMLPDLASARRMPWVPSRDLDLDWRTMEHLEPGKPVAFYRPHTRARLPEPYMRAEFAVRMNALERQLWPLFPWLQLPPAARVALLDMGYNLGPGRLAKFARLRAEVALAVNEPRHWRGAAAECTRTAINAKTGQRVEVNPARNEATRQLFLKCAP